MPPEDEIPRYQFPADTEITICEESGAESATLSVIYRGLVSTGVVDTQEIEMTSPNWLLDTLLANRIPAKEPPKITFVLTPWNAVNTAGLEELPQG